MDVEVNIQCTTIQYTVGVDVSGLAEGNTVEFDNNGESLTANADGKFNFATALDDSSKYNVIVTTQPTTPNQMCAVESASGSLQGEDVLLNVTCSIDSYFVGGVASGLETGNSVILSLGAEILIVNANDTFIFLNPLANESI